VKRSFKNITLKFLTVPFLLLFLLWPAIYNGQPLFSPDTSAYVRGFDAGVVWLSGRTTDWTTWVAKLHTSKDNTEDQLEVEPSFQGPTFVMAGRSVSYGAVLYFGEILGGFWASIVLQAASVLVAVMLTLRHLESFSWPRLVLTVVTLALVSSLPFFTSFLLPDIFAGIALLGAANLLALAHRFTRLELVFWILTVAAAMVFHPTHLLIGIALILGAVIARLVRIVKLSTIGVVALTLAAGTGIASEFAFSYAIEKVLGVQISRPPVLMARMIANGAGASYLREKCPQAGMVVCEFVDRLTSNSDAFLWDTSPATGIYRPAPVEKRRELGNEQYKFAAAVLAFDPWGQITAGLQDAFQQFGMIGFTEFPAAADQALPSLPRIHAERMMRSPLTRHEFPIETFSTVAIIVSIMSLLFIVLTLIQRWYDIAREYKIFCLVIFSGILANAFVCGALSGPHERYQSRITWLIPLLALLFCYERWLRTKETPTKNV
jgi:hypothetical protein